MGLSGVKGKEKSRVKVGTKWVCSKFIKRCDYLFMGEETGGAKKTNVTSTP